jgi:hypothetical protein
MVAGGVGKTGSNDSVKQPGSRGDLGRYDGSGYAGALGEREHVAPITQSQLAATIAAFMGQDFRRVQARGSASPFEALSVHH